MFTLLFIAFLLTDILLRLWLASRQIRHVMRCREEVPDAFATRIGLYSHQRAADYTVAKMRLTMVERVTEAAVLVGFTLMGACSSSTCSSASCSTTRCFASWRFWQSCLPSWA